MKEWKLYSLLALTTIVMLFATLNFHRQSKIFDYNSEIFADKAGYYVYLPYNTPQSLDQKFDFLS